MGREGALTCEAVRRQAERKFSCSEFVADPMERSQTEAEDQALQQP